MCATPWMERAAPGLRLNTAGVAGTGSAEAIEGPDSVGVTIGPVRLQTVIADPIDRSDFEGAVRELARCGGNASEEVRFSRATRAGTVSAQVFQEVIRLVSILPNHRELVSEDFKPACSHRDILLEQ